MQGLEVATGVRTRSIPATSLASGTDQLHCVAETFLEKLEYGEREDGQMSQGTTSGEKNGWRARQPQFPHPVPCQGRGNDQDWLSPGNWREGSSATSRHYLEEWKIFANWDKRSEPGCFSMEILQYFFP